MPVYRLPEKQDPEGTYMEIASIEFLIQTRLVPGQPEGATAQVWDDILHDVFSPRAGFSTGPEYPLAGGRADLFTSHVVFDTRREEKKFFIVECKAPGEETSDSVWCGASEQVKRYLGGIKSRNRKFGAVAIGRVVQFYELSNDGQLDDFDGDGAIYWLDRQCQDIMRKLVYFREHY